MQDSVKYYSALIGLKFLSFFCSVTDLVSYFCGMVYSSTFSILTGLENAWCFYDNTAVPVQHRFSSSSRNHNIEWYYYKRTREWVHRSAVFGKPGKRCPWMMVTLVKPNGDMEDLSEFFAGHRFYMPCGYIQWPTAEQMLAAWSIETYNWYLGDNATKTMMTVMDKNCEEHSFYIGLQDDDSVRAYWRTFGMNYSADSSAVPSEVSTDSEEDEAVEDEVEEEVDETSDEENTEEAEAEEVADTEESEVGFVPNEETTEQPVIETTENVVEQTDTASSDIVLLPESPDDAETEELSYMDQVD